MVASGSFRFLPRPTIPTVSHMVQVSDTQVISARTVTQLRFQYRHPTHQNPFSIDPTVSVLDSFDRWRQQRRSISLNTQDRYELQSLTSMTLGKHALTFGGRVRWNQAVNALSGYNGTFTFHRYDGVRHLPKQASLRDLHPLKFLLREAEPTSFPSPQGTRRAKRADPTMRFTARTRGGCPEHP